MNRGSVVVAGDIELCPAMRLNAPRAFVHSSQRAGGAQGRGWGGAMPDEPDTHATGLITAQATTYQQDVQQPTTQFARRGARGCRRALLPRSADRRRRGRNNHLAERCRHRSSCAAFQDHGPTNQLPDLADTQNGQLIR